MADATAESRIHRIVDHAACCAHLFQSEAQSAERIRVRGAVQGVGFRPMVWRLATEYGLCGWVANDAQGVLIHASGRTLAIDSFIDALPRQLPLLARIDAIEREAISEFPDSTDFRIVPSRSGKVRTGIVPDAATCPECLAEIADPAARRYRYPFTNCTHCGPRLTIVDSIPYDREATSMRTFPLCPQCAAEYENPQDRRFHAQPIACPVCGPHVWLENADGQPLAAQAFGGVDDIDVASSLIERGDILAIKGLGGFQLACDAGNESTVRRLRQRKQRERKPFALMARDLDVVRRYCVVSEAEAALLLSPAAPIVILETTGKEHVSMSVAPGVTTLGVMLPNTPLHHLLLQRMNRPIVLTSGNLSDEPQCIDHADARARLGDIADVFLMHDRGIARRIDDSVVRVMSGKPRLLRRARGYSPAPFRLPEGFAAAPPVLAMGGELKNTFCLLRDGEAIVSHHIGDLADAYCHDDYVQSISAYQQLFEHEARIVAVDTHPEYLSRKLGLAMAGERGLACAEIQHHHAHIAACMAENGIALNTSPILGVALDGLGFGDDGGLWGGEFFIADYRQFKRLASFKPVAMPGGARAIREPWRNTYAQLMDGFSWDQLVECFGELDLCRFLAQKPCDVLNGMMNRGVNSPLASSCGRLFDAVAAAVGICRERILYEGQAAIEFEALVDAQALTDVDDAMAYPFAVTPRGDSGFLHIDPLPMWNALLGDLLRTTPAPIIAARFHKGLAIAIVNMLEILSRRGGGERVLDTVALSGGVFQNRVLLEQVVMRLEHAGFTPLVHCGLPAGDGGVALGQAVIAAAKTIARRPNQ